MPFPRETNSPKITTRIHKQAVVWQTGNNNLFMVIEIEESPILLGWLDWKWERKQRQIKSLTLCSNLANGLNDIQSIEGKCVCVCVSLTSCSVSAGGSAMSAHGPDRRGRPGAECGWSGPATGTRAVGPEENPRHTWVDVSVRTGGREYWVSKGRSMYVNHVN